MGLFDYVRSSYDLGEGFTNVELQTKSFQEDYDGFFDQYWIDPKGRLFQVLYDGTQDLVDDSNGGRWPLTWVPNGNHGKVLPIYWTGTLRLVNKDGEKNILMYLGQIIQDNISNFRECPKCHTPIFIPDKHRRAKTAIHPECL